MFTKDHKFIFEGELFKRGTSLSVHQYIQICTKCGAYEKRKIGSGVVRPVHIYRGPDKRMRQYWKAQRE